jgi:hypothetical protein
MRTYKAFFKGRTCIVEATSSYHAQGLATVIFKARKSRDVTVLLCDSPINTASL